MKDAEQNPSQTNDSPSAEETAENPSPSAAASADEIGTPADTAPEVPESVTLTGEEFTRLQEQAAKADQNWEMFLRERAELENLRKRVAREKQDAVKYANEGLISSLLPVLDNFEAAMVAAGQQNSDTNVDALKTGVSMILGQLKNLLSDLGLQEIDATGKAFDPTQHEALGHEESTDVPEGEVLRQLRKGYRLKERLIRAASVFVAKAPETKPESETGESEEAGGKAE